MVKSNSYKDKGVIYETYSLNFNNYKKSCKQCSKIISIFKNYPMKLLTNMGVLGYYENETDAETLTADMLYDWCTNGNTTVIIGKNPEDMVIHVDPFYEEINISVKSGKLKKITDLLLSSEKV